MELETKPFVVNFGPHHPSTHGVFRMRVILDGEVIVDLEPIYGYLHRGIEKLAEGRTYTQNIPYTDRLEYRVSMVNNFAYVLAVEKLAGIEVPERAQLLRVLFAELMRISNHLTAIGFLTMELGAMATPLFYMYREREKIMDLCEMACGQRLTHNYMRIGGLSHDIPDDFLPAIRKFVKEMPGFIDEYDQLLKENEIILARTVGIGILPADMAIDYSCSGPMLRGSGVPWDIRKSEPYSGYENFDFDVPVGDTGDVYDRYRVRIEEMRQSVRILEQALNEIPPGPVCADVPLLLRPPKGEVYSQIETGQGALGFHLVSDGSIAPYRFRIRPPSLINLSPLRELCKGWKIGDMVVILGSIDINLAEVDR
jgi:NADH-quinone oxidoreductase subunit D